jgi:hypothetical protein
MAVKAVNDTAGPNELVPTLFVFGTYPQISTDSPSSPLITKRADAVYKIMQAFRKLSAERQIITALYIRNEPDQMLHEVV